MTLKCTCNEFDLRELLDISTAIHSEIYDQRDLIKTFSASKNENAINDCNKRISKFEALDEKIQDCIENDCHLD